MARIRIITPLILILSITLLFTPSMAEDDYVRFAKSLMANDYDDNLPTIPVEQWITSALHGDIVAVWGEHITDCGEQTGDPKTDKGRDMPMCAEVELKKGKETVGYLLLLIGTEKKGKLKESAGLYLGYIDFKDKRIFLKKLSELPEVNRK